LGCKLSSPQPLQAFAGRGTTCAMGDAPAGVHSDEEFLELLGFLTDPKLEVQRFAAEGVLAQTESQDFLEYCRRQPRKAARPLLRLAEKAEADAATSGTAANLAAGKARTAEEQKAARMAAMEAVSASAAGSSALQALVNISAVPSVRDELVELSAPRRAAEAMRGGWLEGRSGLAHWYAMLLANITTAKAGQEAICADENLLRFLLAAYVSKPRPPARDGYEDPLINLGKVIGNMCALESGRRLLAGGEQGPTAVATLAGELADRGRRADVVNCFRNLCLDVECHSAVIAANPIASFARFLYPWDKADPTHRAELPEHLATALAAEGAALTGDVTVRHSVAICVVGLCRTREGRDYLRSQGTKELLRAWQLEESEEETRNAIEASVPALGSEEEFEAQQQAGQLAEQDQAEPAAAAPVVGDAAAPVLPRVAPGPLPKPDEKAAEGDMNGLFDGIEGVDN